MEKNSTYYFTVISIVFFILIGILGTVRFFMIRSESEAMREASFAALSKSLSTAYEIGGGFDSEVFRSTAKRSMHDDPSLRMMLVYSYDDGPLYFLPRFPGDYDTDEIDFTGSDIPKIGYDALNETKFVSSFNVPEKTGVVIEGVYIVLDKDGLHPFLRDLLIVYSIFFLVTCLFLVAGSFIRNKNAEAAEPRDTPESDGDPADMKSSSLHGTGFREHIPEYRPDGAFEDFSIDLEDLGGPGSSETVIDVEREVFPEKTGEAVIGEEPGTAAERRPEREESESEPIGAGETVDEENAETFRVADDAERSEEESKPAEGENQPGEDREPGISTVPEQENAGRETDGERDGTDAVESVLNDPENEDREITLALIGVPAEMSPENRRRMHALIETSFSDVASIVEKRDGSILVILFDTELDSAIEESEKLFGHVHYELRESIRVGLTVRNMRDVGASQLVREAGKALKRTRDERGERIIGFRPDPEKYRARSASIRSGRTAN